MRTCITCSLLYFFPPSKFRQFWAADWTIWIDVQRFIRWCTEKRDTDGWTAHQTYSCSKHLWQCLVCGAELLLQGDGTAATGVENWPRQQVRGVTEAALRPLHHKGRRQLCSCGCWLKPWFSIKEELNPRPQNDSLEEIRSSDSYEEALDFLLCHCTRFYVCPAEADWKIKEEDFSESKRSNKLKQLILVVRQNQSPTCGKFLLMFACIMHFADVQQPYLAKVNFLAHPPGRLLVINCNCPLPPATREHCRAAALQQRLILSRALLRRLLHKPFPSLWMKSAATNPWNLERAWKKCDECSCYRWRNFRSLLLLEELMARKYIEAKKQKKPKTYISCVHANRKGIVSQKIVSASAP